LRCTGARGILGVNEPKKTGVELTGVKRYNNSLV